MYGVPDARANSSALAATKFRLESVCHPPFYNSWQEGLEKQTLDGLGFGARAGILLECQRHRDKKAAEPW